MNKRAFAALVAVALPLWMLSAANASGKLVVPREMAADAQNGEILLTFTMQTHAQGDLETAVRFKQSSKYTGLMYFKPTSRMLRELRYHEKSGDKVFTRTNDTRIFLEAQAPLQGTFGYASEGSKLALLLDRAALEDYSGPYEKLCDQAEAMNCRETVATTDSGNRLLEGTDLTCMEHVKKYVKAQAFYLFNELPLGGVRPVEFIGEPSCEETALFYHRDGDAPFVQRLSHTIKVVARLKVAISE